MELIDRIREELKNAPDRPYREGAWEAFKATYAPVRKLKWMASFGTAAAAAVLIGFLFFYQKGGNRGESPAITELRPKEKAIATEPYPKDAIQHGGYTEKGDLQVDDRSVRKTDSDGGTRSSENPVRSERGALGRTHSQTLVAVQPQGLSSQVVETKKVLGIPMRIQKEPTINLHRDGEVLPIAEINPNFAYQRDASSSLSPKKIRLFNRLELGAFISPSKTDQSFDLGGGLVFAYRLSEKLAIRTGASFNQYEVGMLSAQVQKIGERKQAAASVKNSEHVISKEASSLRADNFFMPNLNAVTGKVQTLDIPLEIRYNLSKDIYATGGVSYAAVLSQERFDHYEESASIPLYSSASDSEKPAKNPVTTVERRRISEDKNINTDGFGGFVNFSVGKRTSISRTMKISVEPFVKLPVGQFKRADMNYTNGGIRVITSF